MSGAPPSVTIGIPAHNGGQFFKWAADEDAFESTCLERCVNGGCEGFLTLAESGGDRT